LNFFLTDSTDERRFDSRVVLLTFSRNDCQSCSKNTVQVLLNEPARLSRPASDGRNLLTLVHPVWSDSLHLNKCALWRFVHRCSFWPFYKNYRAYYEGLSQFIYRKI